MTTVRNPSLKVLAATITCALAVVLAPLASVLADEPIEEIVVKGIRGSLTTALDAKRNADSFVDAIAAEDIGKFPDQNIAESLQRVPGVTIDRDAGEGRQITIRGFGPDFNIVTMNNRQLATITGGRDFDFQVIASQMISGSEVFKSPTADRIEGSIGGLVNLQTLRPLNRPGYFAGGEALVRHQELGENTGTELSGVITNTFANDTVGVLLAATYTDITQRLDYAYHGRWGVQNYDPDGAGPEPSVQIRRPNRAGFELREQDRERLGINAALQWRPTERVDLTLDALYVDMTREHVAQTNVHLMQLAFANGGANVSSIDYDSNGTLQGITSTLQPVDFGYTVRGGDIETQMLGANARFFVTDAVTIEADLAWSNAKGEELWLMMFPGMKNSCPAGDPDAVICDDPPGNVVTWVNADIPHITHSFDFTDPSLMRTHFNRSQRDDVEDDIVDFKLDVDWQVDAGLLTSIKAGVAVLDRQFDFLRYDNDGNNRFPIQPGSPWDGFASFTTGRVLNPSDNLFTVVTFDDLLSEASGPMPRSWLRINSYDEFCDYLAANTGNDLGCTLMFIPRGSSFVEEKDTAAYVRFDFGGTTAGDKTWRANAGLRYVETELVANGFDQPLLNIEARDPTGGTTELIYTFGPEEELVAKRKYDDILGSVNFMMNLTDSLIIRAAWGQTLTRPDTGDIGPSFNLNGNFESVNLTGDNPDLKPYKAESFDLGLEYYAENGNAFSVAFFHKDITDFISTVVTQFDSGFDHPAFGDIIINDRRKQNRPGGTVEGFEIAALVFLDNLPGFWGNFGMQANYTYVDSEDKAANDNVSYPDPQNVKLPKTGLEGFTPNSYNLILFYEDPKISSRLAYNWRDDFMDVRIGADGLPEHYDEFGSLDFSLGWQITDSTQLRFEALNLTDEETLRYYDIRDRRNDVMYTGRRYQAGVRLSFE